MRRHILLHACCAPCATAAIEILDKEFDGDITVLYYNPNIAPRKEMETRFEELSRYLSERYGDKIPLIKGEYDAAEWMRRVAPLSASGEGGKRCFECYYMRLHYLFEKAKELGVTDVSTTLSISPHKDKKWLDEIGRLLEKYYHVSWYSHLWDYRRSVELSKEYNLYRQDYCGCIFSLKERNERVAAREQRKKERIVNKTT